MYSAEGRAAPGLHRSLGAIALASLAVVLSGTGLRADPVKIGDFPSSTLQIIVPANPGGGLDTTARELQKVLQADGVAARPVEVLNVPGGGQTVGLARLLSQYKSDGNTLLVMGFGLVGGIHVNKTTVNLDTVTPIAMLTTEYEAIAVSNDSKYKNLQDLLADFKKNPRSIVWGGGPGGSPDHLLVGALAKALGIDPKQVNYVAFSGSEPRAQIMGNQVTAGVVGFGELKADGEAGLLRVLAVSGDKRLPGSNIPTIKETGTDVVLTNWRGLVGGPSISKESREGWIQMLTRLHDGAAWKATLKAKDWTDAFMTGAPFGTFMKSEDQRTRELVRDLGLAN